MGRTFFFGSIHGPMECRLPVDVDQVQQGWNCFLSHPLDFFESTHPSRLQVFLNRFKLIDHSIDEVIWKADQLGPFSVSDAVKLIVQAGNFPSPAWPKVVWGNNVPSKIMLFHWLAIKQSVPVRVILFKRHILPPNHSLLCNWCMNEDETIEHLLLHCPWSFKIWAELFRWWNLRWIIPCSVEAFSFDWFYGMGLNASKYWKLIGPATLWAIWIARNDFIFKGKFTCRSVIVRNIKLKVFLWATNLKLCHGFQAYVWDQNPFLLFS
ncbi:uncharacterized protein [Rutidosis leptorrhynchoides]|uniref:uncharacterized protein n=1 Tax=Rutidosis leptorrhynchoides TaxID=125765 RepID=UPI003A99D6A2